MTQATTRFKFRLRLELKLLNSLESSVSLTTDSLLFSLHRLTFFFFLFLSPLPFYSPPDLYSPYFPLILLGVLSSFSYLFFFLSSSPRVSLHFLPSSPFSL